MNSLASRRTPRAGSPAVTAGLGLGLLFGGTRWHDGSQKTHLQQRTPWDFMWFYRFQSWAKWFWKGTQWLGFHRNTIGLMVTGCFLGSWLETATRLDRTNHPEIVNQLLPAENHAQWLGVCCVLSLKTGLLAYVCILRLSQCDSWHPKYITSGIQHCVTFAGRDNHPQCGTWRKYIFCLDWSEHVVNKQFRDILR